MRQKSAMESVWRLAKDCAFQLAVLIATGSSQRLQSAATGVRRRCPTSRPIAAAVGADLVQLKLERVHCGRSSEHC